MIIKISGIQIFIEIEISIFEKEDGMRKHMSYKRPKNIKKNRN
jgi:hypothetical protein